ncbi:MAG TPA: quinohemoprotein amine dehydrogenase subunit alpha [Bryobacteraceae bacterium]|jgi:quinohemoprotein amine dehydrogenase|nr:quinohemoprotein amine dehydrogenase subunit alpha [Bryobacteraceae bacterium]
MKHIEGRRFVSLVLGAVCLLGAAPAVLGQGRGRGGRGGAPAGPSEDGIPVTNELVLSKCGGCHKKDEKSNLSRISWIRTTPEGWEEAIKRMVRLNGLTLEPADAKLILKYLSDYHGLAPEEAKPVMYMAEHRIQDEPIPNESLRVTCMNCHALGRPFQWRRTREEWSLLADMHSALYPTAESAFRRNGGGRGGAGAGAAGRGGANAEGGVAAPATPISLDATLDFLGKNYPLHTPEWASWRARMGTPRLAGRWLISAHISGRGKYYGEMTIAQGAADDEFTTTVKLQSVNGGPAIDHTGSGLVYAGYSWRGRSKGGTLPATASPDDLRSEMREALWFSPDRTWAQGRWFWGEYQEFGVDVKMIRATADPVLLTLDRYSLKAGSQDQKVRLIGNNFPSQVAVADLDFGSGVTVASVAAHTASQVDVLVNVAADAVNGKRDVAFHGAVLEGALAVYDKVDYIKVLPEASLARLGGDARSSHPRGYQQLEAMAYQRGEDGKPHTDDDVELGPIDVTWSVEEFYSVFGDDDKEFVGTLDHNGLFTPNTDGPNPQRKFGRNNYGDVWVVATAKNEKDKEGRLLTGRSYLIVTVPTYIRWDQPEVGK